MKKGYVRAICPCGHKQEIGDYPSRWKCGKCGRWNNYGTPSSLAEARRAHRDALECIRDMVGWDAEPADILKEVAGQLDYLSELEAKDKEIV